MAEKRKSNPRFAVCVRNEGYEASPEESPGGNFARGIC
jgi:hypothetical protein